MVSLAESSSQLLRWMNAVSRYQSESLKLGQMQSMQENAVGVISFTMKHSPMYFRNSEFPLVKKTGYLLVLDTCDVMHKDLIATVQTIEDIGTNVYKTYADG